MSRPEKTRLRSCENMADGRFIVDTCKTSEQRSSEGNKKYKEIQFKQPETRVSSSGVLRKPRGC